MIKVVFLAILSVVCVVVAQVPGFGGCPKVKTQETFDLTKYLGTWYEIEKFPFNIEKGKCVKARYTAKENGHIEVYNTDIEDDGKEVVAIGDAYRPDDNQQGKLLVKFAEGAPYASYFVVHTDYDQYSLVFSCGGIVIAHLELAWILSRNSTLDPTIVQQLKDELACYKIDVSKFTISDQSGCES